MPTPVAESRSNANRHLRLLRVPRPQDTGSPHSPTPLGVLGVSAVKSCFPPRLRGEGTSALRQE
nr:hypothetical protein [uncultured bacterium]